MKLKGIIFTIGTLFALSSCVEFGATDNQFSPDFDTDYEFTYGLRKVVQTDPANPAGIDIAEKLDFFKTYQMKFFVENGKISALQFVNEGMPFDVYSFPLPTEKTAAVYDANAVPPCLKLKTGEVIAEFISGEFQVKFNLDLEEISYTYYFKTLDSTRENK